MDSLFPLKCIEFRWLDGQVDNQIHLIISLHF